MQWLESDHRELVERYSCMYSTGAYEPEEFRRGFAQKIRPILHRPGPAPQFGRSGDRASPIFDDTYPDCRGVAALAGAGDTILTVCPL